MDKGISVRDVDLEYIGSVSTSRSKSSTTTLFPPILQSQATSPEARDLEEPTLCKKIVHVHRKASEKQQKLDAAWLNTAADGEAINCSIHSNSDTCNRLVESHCVYEDEDDNKSVTMTGLPSIGSAAHFMKQKLLILARQWRDGVSPTSKWTTIEASLRITSANWVWCLVLGTWLEQKTARKWGPVEIVLANIVCGCLFELFGGQAILIIGPSSPSLIFIVAITTTAKHLGVDAVPWMGWIGMWGSLVLLLLAVSNACRLMSRVTFFSWGVVCVFIRLTFLWAAMEQIAHMFTNPSLTPDSALFSLWLATTAFFVVLFLENTRKWNTFEQHTHHTFADYGPMLVLILFTAIPLLPKLNRTHILQVSLPESGYHTDQILRLGCVSLRVLPYWAILLAVIPGIMLAGVLFVYHDATSGLLQDDASWAPLYKNSKKWDLCIVAFLVFLCSIFGLPYACGMMYQNQLHVRALTLKFHDYSDVEDRRGLVTKVQVQRVSGLGASLFSAAFLLPPVRRIITRIPVAILTGLLLHFACHLYGSWDITVHIIRFFKSNQANSHRRSSSKSALCVYTISQIGCILIIMIVSKTPAAVMFPLFVLLTLWVRHSAMRSLFQREDFLKIDTRLHKDCSDMSSSGQLSMASHDPHACVQQAWPKISIPQTLKSAIMVPIPEVQATQQHNPTCEDGIQAEIVAEIESPLPYAMSPSLLHATNRRLKERSRRRCKRKRQLSIDNAEAESSEQQHEEHAPIPPLLKAMMQGQNYPSLYEQDEDINLSKRVSPRLSPQFFRKSKQRPGQEKPLEVHSNLLYEPKRPASKSHSERRMKMEMEEPSGSIAVGLEKNENDIQSPDHRQETNARFQGSPGIGRCIRGPQVFKNQSSTSIYKKKHLKLSIAIPRGKAFPKEDIYPGNVGAHDPPRKPYPRLRRSKTSRWPTTHNDSHERQQQQRHSTSIAEGQIDGEVLQ